MRGDEQRIVDAFCAWLEDAGWRVQREVDFCDVVAERNGERLYAEAKGRTAAVGLDIDTMFGQILRRMPIADDPQFRFAAVVPAEAETAVRRIPERVLQLLRVETFAVDDLGGVRRVGGHSRQKVTGSKD